MVCRQNLVLLTVLLLVDWSACQDISSNQQTIRSKRAIALLASLFNGAPVEHLLPGLISGGTQNTVTNLPGTRPSTLLVEVPPPVSRPSVATPNVVHANPPARVGDVGLIAIRPVQPGPVAHDPTASVPAVSAAPKSTTARPATPAPVSFGAIPSTNTPARTPPTASSPLPNHVGCSGNFTSSITPTSVHRLKVGDIKVVAAMGDSITAANGAQATNIFSVLTEYRGRAFSIGGDLSYTSGVTTLPNILKEFNAQVHGFSIGFGTETSSGANLNVASAGAQARDMASQATSLIAKLRADPSIDVNNDWKIVTLFVGGNDLCQSCVEPRTHSASKYKAGVERALDILHSGLPRTLVNVVEVFDIDVVIHLARSNFLCRLVIGNVCPCGMSSAVSQPALKALSQQYRTVLEQLVATGKYDSRSDFTVVIQPFFSQLTIPRTSSKQIDFSYFAPDCFHLSDKGQQAAGRALWNNMVQSTVNKQKDLLPLNPLSCPTTDFIPTHFN